MPNSTTANSLITPSSKVITYKETNNAGTMNSIKNLHSNFAQSNYNPLAFGQTNNKKEAIKTTTTQTVQCHYQTWIH